MDRISWEQYFFGIVDAVSRRADCTRRQVGAIIVDTDHRLVAAGYNGAPPGAKGCLSDGACPRGKHYRALYPGGTPAVLGTTSVFGKFCGCGNSWPCDETAVPGSSYDTGAGSCISIHAEANCLLDARCPVKGFEMYVTDEPCEGCTRLIRGAQLLSVKWPQGSLSF
jgi:dCMP deaminase